MKIWYGNNCKQCKGLNEPYMIKDEIFKIANRHSLKGFLCISCVEQNIGRKLIIEDFCIAPINEGIFLFNAISYIKHGKRYLDICKDYIRKT